MRQRKGEEGIFTRQSEFPADIGAVVLDCADADEQFIGDLFILLREKNTPSIAAILGGLVGDEFSPCAT
jgi:hypothetical protein